MKRKWIWPVSIGVDEFGELQADRYYEALFQRFDEIAEAPTNTSLLTTFGKGIDAAFMVSTVSTIEFVAMWLRL